MSASALPMLTRLADAFYGTQDDNADLHNVDVMTDISMAPSAFTRYTVAPSAMSKSSKCVMWLRPSLHTCLLWLNLL